MSQRDFFHPPASEWATYIERGRVTHRLEKDLGLGYVHIGDNLFLFFERKGIKEWDGVRLKRWVEITKVGWGNGCGPISTVAWVA